MPVSLTVAALILFAMIGFIAFLEHVRKSFIALNAEALYWGSRSWDAVWLCFDPENRITEKERKGFEKRIEESGVW